MSLLQRLPPALWATPRAQLAWRIAAGVLLLGVPIALEVATFLRTSANEELAEAFAEVQGARAELSQRKQRAQSIAARYGRVAPPLGGLLEQEAKKVEVQLTDSVDRPEVVTGKIYTERQTVVHMKKSGIVPILMMFEGVEQSGYPLSIQRLNLRKRGGEADAYDVELGVVAYERKPAAAKGAP